MKQGQKEGGVKEVQKAGGEGGATFLSYCRCN